MNSNKAQINNIDTIQNDICSTSTFSKKLETSNHTQMNNSSFNEITSYYQSPLMQNLVSVNQRSKSNQLSNRYNNSNSLKEMLPNNKNQSNNMNSNTQNSNYIPQQSEYPIQTFQNKENIPNHIQRTSPERGVIHSFGNLQTSSKKLLNHSSIQSDLAIKDQNIFNGQQQKQQNLQIQENSQISFNRSKSFHNNDQASLNLTNMQGLQITIFNQNNQKKIYSPQDQVFNNPLTNNNNLNQLKESNNSAGFQTHNRQPERMNEYIQKLNFVSNQSNQNMAKSSNLKMFAQNNIEKIQSNFYSHRSSSQHQYQTFQNHPTSLQQSISQRNPSFSQNSNSLKNNLQNQNLTQNQYNNQQINTKCQSILFQPINQGEQIQYQQNCSQKRDEILKERILNLDLNNLQSTKNINNNKILNQNMNQQYNSKAQSNLNNFYQQSINQQNLMNEQQSQMSQQNQINQQTNNINQINQQSILNLQISRSQQNQINQQNLSNVQNSRNDENYSNYTTLKINNNVNQIDQNSCNVICNNHKNQDQNLIQINKINSTNRNTQNNSLSNQDSLKSLKSPTKHILHKIFNQSGRFFEDLRGDSKDLTQQQSQQIVENKQIIQFKQPQKDENQGKSIETLMTQQPNYTNFIKKKSIENVSNCLVILENPSDEIENEELEQKNYKFNSRDQSVVDNYQIQKQQIIINKNPNIFNKDQSIVVEQVESFNQKYDQDKMNERISKTLIYQNKCDNQQLSSTTIDHEKVINHKQYKKQLLENIVKELEKDKSFENICKKNYQTLKSNEKRHVSRENSITPFHIRQDSKEQLQDQIKQTSTFNHESEEINYLDQKTQDGQEVVKLQKIIEDLKKQNLILMQNQQVQQSIRLQSQMMKQEAQIKLLQKELKIQKNLNQDLEDKLEMYLNSANFNSVRNI